MRLQDFIALVGGAMIVISLVLGFSDVTSRSGVLCGSAFAPNLSEAEHEQAVDRLAGTLVGGSSSGTDFVGECETAFGSRPMLAWLLLGAGVILLAGGLFVRPPGEAAGGDGSQPPDDPPIFTKYG